MRLIQFTHASIGTCVGVLSGTQVQNVTARDATIRSIPAAFQEARKAGRRLGEHLEAILHQRTSFRDLNYRQLLEAGAVLAPVIDEPGTRVLVSGTGLTHLGSVDQRDAMHTAEEAGSKSDSRRMFEAGRAGGRPAPGQRGTAPEWFYKGDASILRGPGQPLEISSFAPDGGEEPEIAGVYMIDDQGVPWRLGFVQGNEWSDHVTENISYLHLAPSKLRTCAIGPELFTKLHFGSLCGRCRVWRDGQEIYDSGELRTGEGNMCHSLANIEDHQFKFPQHRRPGDVHVHFFGTCKLSYPGRTWRYETGDVVEVAFDGLGEPLRNPVRREEPSRRPVTVEQA